MGRAALQSAFVSYRAQEIVPPLRIGGRLHAFRRTPVHHTEDRAALLRFRHDHFHRIRRRAEDPAHFRHLINARSEIDRIPFAHRNHEQVPRPDRSRIARCIGLQILVVPIHADQARARSLVEGDAELHAGYRVHNRFVQILHRLDEMAMT